MAGVVPSTEPRTTDWTLTNNWLNLLTERKRKLRLRRIKGLAWGHAASQRWSQDWTLAVWLWILHSEPFCQTVRKYKLPCLSWALKALWHSWLYPVTMTTQQMTPLLLHRGYTSCWVWPICAGDPSAVSLPAPSLFSQNQCPTGLQLLPPQGSRSKNPPFSFIFDLVSSASSPSSCKHVPGHHLQNKNSPLIFIHF